VRQLRIRQSEASVADGNREGINTSAGPTFRPRVFATEIGGNWNLKRGDDAAKQGGFLLRAAVDVMGGDHAPGPILQGCWDAAPLLGSNDQVLLIGDAPTISAALETCGLSGESKQHYKVIPVSQHVGMDESPVEAIRSKPDSGISVMCKMVAKGEADVAISAGNTGACVAAAQLRMRTLPGVSRPGIGVVLSTFYGPVVICDVGANPEPKPKHLEQYAIMASAYSQAVCGVANPRVGILSIGEEDAKGNALVKEARKLMKDEPLINFIGNVEGRDFFAGKVDVIVCDGFVGNIVLKFIEGMAEGLFKAIGAEVKNTAPELTDKISPIIKKVYQKLDWRDYGGAPLLGVGGYCLICHGASDARAIKNAIRVGKTLAESGINDRIVEIVRQTIPVEE
jgi:phosphate acyltransferase